MVLHPRGWALKSQSNCWTSNVGLSRLRWWSVETDLEIYKILSGEENGCVHAVIRQSVCSCSDHYLSWLAWVATLKSKLSSPSTLGLILSSIRALIHILASNLLSDHAFKRNDSFCFCLEHKLRSEAFASIILSLSGLVYFCIIDCYKFIKHTFNLTFAFPCCDISEIVNWAVSCARVPIQEVAIVASQALVFTNIVWNYASGTLWRTRLAVIVDIKISSCWAITVALSLVEKIVLVAGLALSAQNTVTGLASWVTSLNSEGEGSRWRFLSDVIRSYNFEIISSSVCISCC